MSNTLLLGGRGQVGTALRAILDNVVSPSRAMFDLECATVADISALVEEADAHLIINCSAYNAVDQAELEEERAHAVNALAVSRLAEVSSDRAVPFVTYSTDYVFDGASTVPYVESDAPHPINAYGRSKLAGEKLALEANPSTLVIRTSWILSNAQSSFTTRIVDAVGRGEEVRVVSDQRGSPTVAQDVAEGTVVAIRECVDGLLHVTNDGDASWYDVARVAAKSAGLDADLVVPCRTRERPTRAARPSYSVMRSGRAEELALPPLRPWNQAVRGLFSI